MAFYYSISGALELNDELTKQLRLLLEKNEDQNPYNASWLLHKGGWSDFAFFGHTVQEQTLDAVRAQVRRIATSLKTIDGEFIDFPEGQFRVIAENDERVSFTWHAEGGTFAERRN